MPTKIKSLREAKNTQDKQADDSSKFCIICQDIFKNSYNFVVYP